MEMWNLLLCLSNGWMQTPCTADVTPTPSSSSMSPTEDESTELVDWLMKYGYLPPSDLSMGQLQAWTAVTKAVRVMQRFAGLKDTGVFDEETMALMNSPRCSLPDQDEPSKSLASEGERGKHEEKEKDNNHVDTQEHQLEIAFIPVLSPSVPGNDPHPDLLCFKIVGRANTTGVP